VATEHQRRVETVVLEPHLLFLVLLQLTQEEVVLEHIKVEPLEAEAQVVVVMLEQQVEIITGLQELQILVGGRVVEVFNLLQRLAAQAALALSS
jgi:hypothetical protein